MSNSKGVTWLTPDKFANIRQIQNSYQHLKCFLSVVTIAKKSRILNVGKGSGLGSSDAAKTF